MRVQAYIATSYLCIVIVCMYIHVPDTCMYVYVITDLFVRYLTICTHVFIRVAMKRSKLCWALETTMASQPVRPLLGMCMGVYSDNMHAYSDRVCLSYVCMYVHVSVVYVCIVVA